MKSRTIYFCFRCCQGQRNVLFLSSSGKRYTRVNFVIRFYCRKIFLDSTTTTRTTIKAKCHLLKFVNLPFSPIPSKPKHNCYKMIIFYIGLFNWDKELPLKCKMLSSEDVFISLPIPGPVYSKVL